MWQQEKLAAANEEENEEIPEQVFNMAVNSITKEEDLASEALAQIHRKQGKYDRAIDMYRKLSLRNPQKIAYFALKIEELLKEKRSMITILTILILLACVVLGFFVLVQNPKGGGLTGAFGSISSQVMGVKQSTDVMEKGTWTAMGVVCTLCVVSVMFYEKPKNGQHQHQARYYQERTCTERA